MTTVNIWRAASMMMRSAKIAPPTAREGRLVMTLIMMLLTATTAWAADITQNTAVVINSGNKAMYNNKSVAGTVPASSAAGNNGNFISKGAIVVDGIELNLTIDGLNVDYSEQYYATLSGISLVNGAILHLTVKGVNTLTAGYGGAGIAVPFGCSLEITEASTGTLNATGGDNYGGGAGIGSRGNANSLCPQGCGDITINGGTINARGGSIYYHYNAVSGAAGIGSSEGSGAKTGLVSYYDITFDRTITGNITINGGMVRATGSVGAAGVGGGSIGTVKTITITGGNVTATAGNGGAAIGSGFNGATELEDKLTCADISILGGWVTAYGNIGYGDSYTGGHVGGSVIISDEAYIDCTGSICPSVQRFFKRTFHITVYYQTLTSTRYNVKVYLPLGKTAYCDLQVEKPGIGTATVDVLYPESQLGSSGTVMISGLTSKTLSLSESSHDVVLGGYYYTFSGTIYDKDIALGTTATFTLDDISDIYVNSAYYYPETAGSGTTAGVAYFSGYCITKSELPDDQTFRVTDSNNQTYTKTVTFPAPDAHQSHQDLLISDGNLPDGVKYIDANHREQICEAFQIPNGTSWGDTGITSWYVVNSEITITERITVKGTVNLILCDGVSLYAKKGITVLEGNSLNIYGQQNGSGWLYADARQMDGSNHTYQYAGIGGYTINIYNNWENPGYGTISIYGGIVNSQGGDYAAGIGGGGNRYGEKVRICGGTVIASGGDHGAGIGSGNNDEPLSQNCGSIEISGGYIHAMGFNGGAGIGGGYNCNAGTITISGGIVVADASGWDAVGAGIGCGEDAGGGTISLDWTNLTDCIYATSYDGNVTFKKDFMLRDTDIKATTSNIRDNTIVPSRTVSFVANGGSGTMSSVPIAVGANYRLPECAFTAPDEGNVFYRWQIGTVEYEPGASITANDNLSVTALWREGSRTVTFNMNGHGEAIETQTVTYRAPAQVPPKPYADGFEFVGWYVGATAYNFNTPVTANTELTAHWSRVLEEPTLTVTGSYTYTGEQIIPAITVKDGETVVPESEYTVTTTNTMKVGTASVTITDKEGGNYKLATASAEFTVLPKPVTVSGITANAKHYDRNTSAEIDCSHAVFSGKVKGDVLSANADGVFANAEYGENKTVNISGLTLDGRDKDNYVLAAEGQQTTTTATIYAPHTVKFADENGTVLDGFPAETVLNGEKATEPVITDANRPVKDGYRFVGWNYNGEPFDFGTPLDFETTTTMTLTPRFLKLHSIYGAPYAGSGSGTVTYNKTVAVLGEEVTVTASPANNSKLAYFSIFYTENNKDIVIPYTMTGDNNEGKFTMPDKDEVHVSGAFSLSDDLLAVLKNATTGYYEVTKAADLVLISSWMAAGNSMSGETIQLKNDIDVSGSDFTSFPYMIKGSSKPYVFMGTLDGNHHTIRGISINNDGSAGLFGALDGTVKDLTVTGSVSGSGNYSSVGSIAQAVSETGTIQDCVSLVEVTSGNSTYTGGIAGMNNGTVSGCHYLGNGVSGAVGTYSNNVAATNCTALFAVEGSDDVTVGATTSNGTIYGDCYHEAGSQVTMALTAGEKDGWTLSGFKYEDNSYNDVNLTANGDGTYTLTVPEENVTLQPNYRYNGLTMQQDAQNRYLVTSVADLNEVAAVTSVLDGCQDMTFLLANDIEFGENDSFGGIAVGLTDEYGNDAGFNGTFDGGGHTISGMNISGRAKNLGFIGYLTGTLQNLTLAYCTVSNTSDADDTYTGMLVGNNFNGYMYGNRVIGGTVSGANAGVIGGYWYPMEASNNLYNDEVAVVSGGMTKAPGECGTIDGDKNYDGNNAAVVGWRVLFVESGQLAPAQLVADGDAAIKPEVSLAPRTHFTFNNKWKRNGSDTEYTFDQSWAYDGITANTTLIPIWDEETKYTVAYSGNGGSGNDVSEQVYASEVSAFRLPNCFYDAPEGCHFSAWRIGDNDYAAGALVDFSDDITAIAQWARNAFELADKADNSGVLNTWKNKVADVTLADRTLFKDGYWNTLCLPFDVVLEGSPLDGNGVEVRTLADASFSDGTLTLTFTEAGAVTTLVAGVPYIIKWDNTGQHLTDADLVFSGVTVKADNTDIDYSLGNGKSIAFRGTYAKQTWETENKSILLLGTNNTLYWPKPDLSDSSNPKYPSIGAQRAYFQMTGLSAGDPTLSRFVLNFGEENIATSISEKFIVNSEKLATAVEWYDMQGRKLNKQPTKPGLYIHGGHKVVIK